MRLPGRSLAELSEPSPARGFLDLVLHGVGIVGVIAVAHAAHHWAVYLAAAVVVAGLQNHLIVLAHECWHGKAFGRGRLDAWVGACLYSYPVGTPYFSDRARHLAHHRLVGRSDDPDWSDYERAQFHRAGGVARYLAGQLLGEKVVLRLLGMVWKESPLAGVGRRVAVDPRETLAIAACQLLLFALFAGFGRWWEYFALWILPLSTVANFLVRCGRSSSTRAPAGRAPRPRSASTTSRRARWVAGSCRPASSTCTPSTTPIRAFPTSGCRACGAS